METNNKIKPTKRMLEALTILDGTGFQHGMSAAQFALKFWPDHLMHVQVTNQGNGACAGKKGWLQAGSYLRKLQNKGLLKTTLRQGFYITQQGRDVLKENKNGIETKNT